MLPHEPRTVNYRTPRSGGARYALARAPLIVVRKRLTPLCWTTTQGRAVKAKNKQVLREDRKECACAPSMRIERIVLILVLGADGPWTARGFPAGRVDRPWITKSMLSTA